MNLNLRPTGKRILFAVILIAAVLITTLAILLFKKDKIVETALAVQVSEVKLIKVKDYKKGQEGISAQGTVESPNQADLKSQVSAQIEKIHVSVGDYVKSGQTLITLSGKDYTAQLTQANALLESAQAQVLSAGQTLIIQNAKLTELLAGPRTEDVTPYETAVKSAKQIVINANTALTNAKTKADDDMDSAIDSAVSGIAKTSLAIMSALSVITDIQYNRLSVGSQDRIRVTGKKAEVIELFLGKRDAGEWVYEYISKLEGGVKAKLESLGDSPSEDEVTDLLADMADVLTKVKDALDTIPQQSNFTSTDIINLAGAKTAIAGEISLTSAKEKSISALNNINKSVISAAESNISNAKNSLTSAENALDLKKLGARSEQVDAQKAAVKQAEIAVTAGQALVKQYQASISSASNQISKTTITAPFDGKISSISAKLGETASMGQSMVSIVDEKKLQIKSYISEKDFSLIQNGFVKEGSDVTIESGFKGKVSYIAPSIDSKTKKIEVDISITDTVALLIIGQNVSVNILASRSTPSIPNYLLPLTSITITQEGAYAYQVGTDLILKEKTLMLGNVIGESVEVRNGLTDDMAIAAVASGLKEGQKVQIK